MQVIFYAVVECNVQARGLSSVAVHYAVVECNVQARGLSSGAVHYAVVECNVQARGPYYCVFCVLVECLDRLHFLTRYMSNIKVTQKSAPPNLKQS